MITKLCSKTFTKLISYSQMFSTTSNLSSTPILDLASKTSISASTKRKRGSTLLWFLGGLVTYGFADWQKFRQREEIIKQLNFRQICLQMEPLELMNTKKNVDKLGFRRVVCKGIFDKEKSIYVGPKPRSISKGSENGFYLVTPLMPIPNESNSMKSPILVNRGWVPSHWKEETSNSAEIDVVDDANRLKNANKQVSSQQNPLWKLLYKLKMSMISKEQASRAMQVEVVGVVRKSEIPGIFIQPNDPISGKWFFVDVPELAKAIGFGEDTIYIEKTNKDFDVVNIPNYPMPRDDEDLVRSKGVPMNNYFYSFLWHCLSVGCFSQYGKKFLRKISHLN
ncbi:unnamed protein product [Cochlearia groenlandica]